MKFLFICLCLLWQGAVLSATAQESSQRPSASSPVPSAEPSAPVRTPPSPEMKKILAFSGRWYFHFEYDPSEGSPGRKTEGKVVFRAGPGGRSLVEDLVEEVGSGKTISAHSVIWWDEKAKGYGGIWCDSQSTEACRTMPTSGKWEGDQFVLNDEFSRDGKKYVAKKVFSEVLPTSFTQTISEGEAGKALKRTVTIHAVRAGQGSAAPASSPKPK